MSHGTLTWVFVIGIILVIWFLIGWQECMSERSTRPRTGLNAFFYGVLVFPAMLVFLIMLVFFRR